MQPHTQPRKKRNSSRVNLMISFTFHALIVVVALYFAARQGLLGKQLKKISINMVKEKPPENLWDMKLSRGGLVDIEFAAQVLQIMDAADGGPLHPHTALALTLLAKAGLVDKALAADHVMRPEAADSHQGQGREQSRNRPDRFVHSSRRHQKIALRGRRP